MKFRTARGVTAGLTLVELIIALSIFSLFLTVLFYIANRGTSVMIKGTTQSGLLQDSQVVSKRLTRDVQTSRSDSFSIGTGGVGISLLSALGDDGRFHYDTGTGDPRWQAFYVYYYDATARTLNVRKVSVVGSTHETNSAPIESFGSGQPVDNYFADGKPLIHHVESARFELDSDGLVVLRCDLFKSRGSGPDDGERMKFSVQALFKN